MDIKQPSRDVPPHPKGKARRDISFYDPSELKKGILVEREHTTDIGISTNIAMDHLYEDPDYYRKLKKMEKTSAFIAGAASAMTDDETGIL